MFRRVHKPGGEVGNRTSQEQIDFKNALSVELRNHFGVEKPFCCITLSMYKPHILGNETEYQNVLQKVLESQFPDKCKVQNPELIEWYGETIFFEMRKFWGSTGINAHHIIAVAGRIDVSEKQKYILKNGIFINSYLHDFLHIAVPLHEVSNKLQDIATEIYKELSFVREKIPALNDDFFDKWLRLLKQKGLIRHSQNRRR